MKIESAQLQLAARHAAHEHSSVQVTLEKLDPPTTAGNSAVVQLSQAGRSAALVFEVSEVALEASGVPEEPPAEDEKLKADLRYQLVKSLLEQITGSGFVSSDFAWLSDIAAAAPQTAAVPTDSPAAPNSSNNPASAANPQAQPSTPQIRETRTETYSESEQTNFQARGSISLADGREIEIALDLTLQRSFSSENTRQLVNGKPVDPLVINLDGQQVALREASVSFDLDGDGQTEQVHFVNQGSAFLALDKNQDGVINNGKELFGPESGDGFQDLAVYDDDRNQVIDENDQVFSQLRLYNQDENGNQQLRTLAEAGLGAIFLQNTSTPFALKDQQNQLQGQVRSSGVYLYESGQVGVVQQVDLVV